MGLNTIHKTSVFYRIIFFLARIFFGLFYRRFIIVGKENIPVGAQVIFASNHQNALMDALAMLFGHGKPVAFLARADIFNKAFVARVLYFLKILPVFRPRDGSESMTQNYETFQRTSKVLKSGMPIAILPEGTHSPIKKLQPLKKGICRIAFLTAESENFSTEMVIVPIGIDYTSYSNAGTDLLLIYGKPIPVSDYYELYRENPQKAIVQLRDRLGKAIHQLMIDVRQDQHYTTYMRLAEMIEMPATQAGYEVRLDRFYKTQEFIQKMDSTVPENPDWMLQLKLETSAYFSAIKRFGLREKLFQKKQIGVSGLLMNFLMSLIVLPIHLVGMFFNYLPYKLPVILSRKVRDKQFLSSLNYGYGLIFFLIWYIIAFIVLLISGLKLSVILVFLVLLAFSGLVAFYHYLHLLRLRGRYRLWKLKHRNKAAYHALTNQRESIIQLMKQRSVF